MIFGLILRGDFLFSISDDRSLRMWCMSSYCQLDEAFVHAARPFAICEGTSDTVLTAGQVYCVFSSLNFETQCIAAVFFFNFLI